MAFRQILQRRCSRFMLDHACKNPKIVVPRIPIPIQQFSSKLSTNSPPILRFNFNKRAYDEGWFHNSKGVGLTIFVFSLGAAIGVSSGRWVTVPYTERIHFVPFYKLVGRILERSRPDEITSFEDEAVDPLHPDSITAKTIFQDIMNEALPIEFVTNRDLEDGSKIEEEEEDGNEFEEDDKWEIVVVDSTRAAVEPCARFGKMYVSNRLIRHYRNQHPMIATIFAHEVGHDLARHGEEQLSKLICSVSMIGTSLYLFSQSTYIRSKLMPFVLLLNLKPRRFLPSFSFVASVGLLSYLVMMMYFRKMEMEADYIGLMLAASAGYDPGVGLMFPIYGLEIGKSVWPQCFRPVPSGEERSLYLSHPRVINEAIFYYHHKDKPT